MTKGGVIKVLHVVRQFFPSNGGLEEHVASLVSRQTSSARVYILTLDRLFRDSTQLPKIQRWRKAIIIRIPFIGYRRFFLPFLGRAFLKRFDVVHVHALDTFVDVISVMSRIGAPRFAFTSHGLFFHTKTFSWVKKIYFAVLSRIALSRAAAVFAVSGSDASRLADIGIRATIIRNPVVPHPMLYSGGDDLLFLGRLSANKNIPKLIPFLAALHSQGFKGRLHIIGSGDAEVLLSLQQTVEANGLSHFVILHGFASAAVISDVMKKCGWSVSASEYEGFGMAMVEGMSAGLLPIMQPNEAFQEINRESGCGLLLDFDQPGPAACEFLLYRQRDLGTERERGRQYAISQSWETVAAEIYSHYLRILKGPQRDNPAPWPARIGQPNDDLAMLPLLPSRRILGVDVVVYNREEAIELVRNRFEAGARTRVAFANANLLMQVRSSVERRAVLKEMIVFNDGVGLDIASSMLYGKRFLDNLNGTDFTPALLKVLPRGSRIFLFGARPGIAASVGAKLREQGYEICGFCDGYTHDDASVRAQINAANAEVVLVALGNPKQEIWMARNHAALCASLIVGVGALFDFMAGAVSRAPTWVQRLRIEWIYRLVQEPRRLAKRYTGDVIIFLFLVLRQKFVVGRAQRPTTATDI